MGTSSQQTFLRERKLHSSVSLFSHPSVFWADEDTVIAILESLMVGVIASPCLPELGNSLLFHTAL